MPCSDKRSKLPKKSMVARITPRLSKLSASTFKKNRVGFARKVLDANLSGIRDRHVDGNREAAYTPIEEKLLGLVVHPNGIRFSFARRVVMAGR